QEHECRIACPIYIEPEPHPVRRDGETGALRSSGPAPVVGQGLTIDRAGRPRHGRTPAIDRTNRAIRRLITTGSRAGGQWPVPPSTAIGARSSSARRWAVSDRV